MTPIKPRLWHTIRQPVSEWVRRQSMVQKLAAEYGYTVRVMNAGQHWEFKRVNLIVEWWPSTGTLMIDKKKERNVCKTFAPVMSQLMRCSGRKATS